MKAKDVYTRFTTPPNLQQHLIRVTAIVLFIQSHWIGDEVFWSNVITAGLLHDMGNIVRFDLDNHPEFLGEELKNIDYWRKVKHIAIDKYGTDDHNACDQMLTEININPDIISLINTKSFVNSIKIAANPSLEPKILLYADMRVAPTGIVTLQERLDEVRSRSLKHKNNPDFPALVDAVVKIEQEISSNTNITLDHISDKTLNIDFKKLINLEI